LAGALQIARVDRRIGAKGTLRRTWLASSLSTEQLSPKLWLALERQRWGIENRTHYVLDVTWQEDQCRVRQPNAVAVLGIFQRIAIALHQAWAQTRPPRRATTRDWVSEHLGNRWLALRRITSPVPAKTKPSAQSR
jgi:predicted transposase YbfD/YdcC